MLHALGVLPGYHGHGLGKKLVGAAAGLATQAGCRAIRLDVLEGNLPARWLYERMGFHYICRTELFYEDTGRMGFWMYELALGEELARRSRRTGRSSTISCASWRTRSCPRKDFTRFTWNSSGTSISGRVCTCWTDR